MTISPLPGTRWLAAYGAALALCLATDVRGVDSVAVVANQATVSEAAAGTVGFTVTRLTLTPTGDLAVKFSVSGSATLVTDYTVTSPTLTGSTGTVTILDTFNSAQITITMSDDTVAEPAEDITITITADPAYTIAAGLGSDSIVILDDEPVLQIAPGIDPGEPSTNGTYTVSYPGTSLGRAIAFTYTVGGTAIAGVDYTALSGSGTILSTGTSTTITVPILNDVLPDDGKTLIVSLTSGSGYFIKPGNGIATMTLGNDDIGVTNVSSSTSNGTYGLGATIVITVTFNQAVAVTGTPTLALATGSTPTLAYYAAGSGTTTLNFAYVVGSLDSSTDLDCTGTTALALNGGTIIKTATTTAALLTLPMPGQAGSLGANRNLVVNGVDGSQKPIPGSVQSTDSTTKQCGLGQGIAALLLLFTGMLLTLRRR